MELLTPSQLPRAAHLLKQGKLVAFPTETVYGLGAGIFHPESIQSIFAVKARPSDNPLIAHVCALSQLEQIAEEIPASFYLLARHFIPGPLTVILKRRSHVPPLVSAGLPTIAVRMPSHPLALQLIEQVGEPLVAPSANLSGKPSATQAKHVLEDFEGKIAAVLDGGATEFGIESTVLNLLGDVPLLMRPGAVSKEAIEAVLGYEIGVASADLSGPVASPGMKYRHYSPRTQIQVFYHWEELLSAIIQGLPGATMLLCRRSLQAPITGVDPFFLSVKEFYSLLRLADAQNYQQIVIFCDEGVCKEAALMNRIVRASATYKSQ